VLYCPTDSGEHSAFSGTAISSEDLTGNKLYLRRYAPEDSSSTIDDTGYVRSMAIKISNVCLYTFSGEIPRFNEVHPTLQIWVIRIDAAVNDSHPNSCPIETGAH